MSNDFRFDVESCVNRDDPLSSCKRPKKVDSTIMQIQKQRSNDGAILRSFKMGGDELDMKAYELINHKAHVLQTVLMIPLSQAHNAQEIVRGSGSL